MNENTRAYARISLAGLIVVGTVWVLAPFLAALLFAAILCLSTWPVFAWLESRLKGRTTLAALLVTLVLALTVLVPSGPEAGMLSDVLSKPLFVAGADWQRLAQQLGTTQVLRVDAAGKIAVTAAMKQRLVFEPANPEIAVVP